MAFVRFHSFCGQSLKLLQAENVHKKALEEASPQLTMLKGRLMGNSFFEGDTIWYLAIVGIVVCLIGLESCNKPSKVELINEEFFPILHNSIVKMLDITIIQECLPQREKLLAYVYAQ